MLRSRAASTCHHRRLRCRKIRPIWSDGSDAGLPWAGSRARCENRLSRTWEGVFNLPQGAAGGGLGAMPGLGVRWDPRPRPPRERRSEAVWERRTVALSFGAVPSVGSATVRNRPGPRLDIGEMVPCLLQGRVDGELSSDELTHGRTPLLGPNAAWLLCTSIWISRANHLDQGNDFAFQRAWDEHVELAFKSCTGG
jgi:hypothetical protein